MLECWPGAERGVFVTFLWNSGRYIHDRLSFCLVALSDTLFVRLCSLLDPTRCNPSLLWQLSSDGLIPGQTSWAGPPSQLKAIVSSILTSKQSSQPSKALSISLSLSLSVWVCVHVCDSLPLHMPASPFFFLISMSSYSSPYLCRSLSLPQGDSYFGRWWSPSLPPSISPLSLLFLASIHLSPKDCSVLLCGSSSHATEPNAGIWFVVTASKS